ncbi:MAG: alpha/beta fold hydrolase [Thermomicrobiales bacterium]|nr:alpha/beta fold hydrolase [Thermomicrobiales bacterium]
MDKIEVNGITMIVRRWSGPDDTGEAPTVLLHGLLQTGAGMANLAAHLARRGAVIAPDLRGRGGSSRPDGGYDPATMAADVAALIEALHLDRPLVIGRLHGGIVAYHLARLRPDLVRGLVLGGTSPDISPDRAERSLAALQALPRAFATYDAAVDFYERGLGLSAARARHDIPSDLARDANGSYTWRHDLGSIAAIEAASSPRDDWDLLAGVVCPTLFLRGQRGEASPRIADKVREIMPDCRTQTILGASHDLFLGPGAEQVFGAIELFRMQLSPAGRTSGETAPPSVGETSRSPAPTIAGRIVAAINARDEQAIADLFASDARMNQYLPEGVENHGGVDLVRAAFWQLLEAFPSGVVEALHTVDSDRELAMLLAVRDEMTGAIRFLTPMFATLANGRIIELTTTSQRIARGGEITPDEAAASAQ